MSHAKGIFVQGRWSLPSLLRAPFGKLAEFGNHASGTAKTPSRAVEEVHQRQAVSVRWQTTPDSLHFAAELFIWEKYASAVDNLHSKALWHDEIAVAVPEHHHCSHLGK